MKEPGLFDEDQASVAARDEAIARVNENAGPAFTAQVTQVVAWMPAGTLCTGESIRRECQRLKVEPHHHNAWGGTMSSLVKTSRLLEETGRWVRMMDESSHARRTPEYRRTNHVWRTR